MTIFLNVLFHQISITLKLVFLVVRKTILKHFLDAFGVYILLSALYCIAKLLIICFILRILGSCQAHCYSLLEFYYYFFKIPNNYLIFLFLFFFHRLFKFSFHIHCSYIHMNFLVQALMTVQEIFKKTSMFDILAINK